MYTVTCAGKMVLIVQCRVIARVLAIVLIIIKHTLYRVQYIVDLRCSATVRCSIYAAISVTARQTQDDEAAAKRACVRGRTST